MGPVLIHLMEAVCSILKHFTLTDIQAFRYLLESMFDVVNNSLYKVVARTNAIEAQVTYLVYLLNNLGNSSTLKISEFGGVFLLQ